MLAPWAARLLPFLAVLTIIYAQPSIPGMPGQGAGWGVPGWPGPGRWCLLTSQGLPSAFLSSGCSHVLRNDLWASFQDKVTWHSRVKIKLTLGG